jgi:hypothetical protein
VEPVRAGAERTAKPVRARAKAQVRAALLAATALVAAALAAAPAGAGSKCAAAKYKASGRYVAAFAKCQAKATAKGAEIDLLCVAKAQSNLASAFAKAEGKDDCLTLGDVVPVQDVLDDPVGEAFEILLPPVSRSCCRSPGGCYWVEDAAECAGVATLGEAGSVCNGETRECVPPPPVGSGTCCEDVTVLGVSEPTCVGVPMLTCSILGGTAFPDSFCHPSKRCFP